MPRPVAGFLETRVEKVSTGALPEADEKDK